MNVLMVLTQDKFLRSVGGIGSGWWWHAAARLYGCEGVDRTGDRVHHLQGGSVAGGRRAGGHTRGPSAFYSCRGEGI